MNQAIDLLHDTFVIEGDLVLARNIFSQQDNSFYYVMRYPFTILDWWQHLCHRFLDDKDFRTSAKDKGLMSQPSVLSFQCRQ